MELCGGTHAAATGEIGLFKLIGESSVAAGVRRIEALTGDAALAHAQQAEQQVHHAALALKSPAEEVVPRIEKLLAASKEQEREIERLKMKLATMQTDALIQQAREIRGVKVIAARVQELDAKGLRNFADVLKQKLQSGIVALAVEEADGRVSLIATVTKDLTGRYHAGNIIKAVAGIIGGSGGGRPDMAQAGGKHPEKLAEAFEKVYQVVESCSA